MKILITGKTGLIGSEISRLLIDQGHYIHYLTTVSHKIKYAKTSKGFFWKPKRNKIDTSCFEGVDVIIHLSGATVAKRWTSTYKKEIIDSRIRTTEVLIEALKKTPNQVKQIISASAIGIYPSSKTELFDETYSKPNKSFLYKVTNQWESRVSEFSQLNLPVCIFRTGIVLSNKNGALVEMAKPIRMGLGATFGSGKQHQSWIHIHDLARLFASAIDNNWEGTYNAVAPNPSTNKKITNSIAAILNKPLFFPRIPRFVMKIVLGEMHHLLYDSQKVSSEKIQKKGFTFQFETVDEALQNLLTS